MREAEFRIWLQKDGEKTKGGLNSRVQAIKVIEKNLGKLGSPHVDLDAAYHADKFTELRKRLKEMRNNFNDGGDDHRKLMPSSENPLNRLSSWSSWLAQYGKFLGENMSQADRIRGNADMARIEPMPTNLILYGPPGTGKTYQTAQEAVALCDGTGTYPQLTGGRARLMARYNELVAEKRISFVTFHQSYDYETFVEGLRPEMGMEEGSSVGFRLDVVPGIFREICTLADQARTRPHIPTSASELDLNSRSLWKMSLGSIDDGNDHYDAALAGKYIALGWGGVINWSPDKFSSLDNIKEAWLEQNPNDRSPSNWNQVYLFRCKMKQGDIVIIPYGNRSFRAIAEVTGDYEFSSEDSYYPHRRPVRWLLTLDAPLPLDLIIEGQFAMRTLYALARDRVNLRALGGLLAPGAEPGGEADVQRQPAQFVLIIDEINRANISKVFGELITLIEPDKRLGMPNELTVKLPYSKKQDFGVPANLHLIGTMNTADRSIALLDTALRRRFSFREIAPDPSLLGVVNGIDLSAVLTTINRRIEYLIDREHRIGHAFFIDCENAEQIEKAMRNKVIPLLQEYFFEDWSRIAAVLGDGFICAERLDPPPGIEGESRFSWSVRSPFGEDAFQRLLRGTEVMFDAVPAAVGEPGE